MVQNFVRPQYGLAINGLLLAAPPAKNIQNQKNEKLAKESEELQTVKADMGDVFCFLLQDCVWVCFLVSGVTGRYLVLLGGLEAGGGFTFGFCKNPPGVRVPQRAYPLDK